MLQYYQQLYRAFLSGCRLERRTQPWSNRRVSKICFKWETGYSWCEENDQLLEQYAVEVMDEL
jgi:hypothetical protein